MLDENGGGAAADSDGDGKTESDHGTHHPHQIKAHLHGIYMVMTRRGGRSWTKDALAGRKSQDARTLHMTMAMFSTELSLSQHLALALMVFARDLSPV